MIFLTRKYFFGDNLTRFHFVKRPGEKFKSFTRSISFWLENLRPLSNAINSKWAVMLWFIGLKFHFERNHNDSSYFLLPFLFILLIFLRLLYIFSRDKWLASRWMKKLFFAAVALAALSIFYHQLDFWWCAIHVYTFHSLICHFTSCDTRKSNCISLKSWCSNYSCNFMLQLRVSLKIDIWSWRFSEKGCALL